MAISSSRKEFLDSLLMAEGLLALERQTCHNPPRANELKFARGLRGGATILMVASFEYYLRQLMAEHLSVLSTQPPKVPFSKLPSEMQVHCVFESLDRALKGSMFPQQTAKHDRLPNIEKACKLVLSGIIDTLIFTDTNGNPNSKTVKTMFSRVGIRDIFSVIQAEFNNKWRSPTHSTFIEDKLNEIVNKRHIVAHTASSLNITRADLRESLRFLKTLAELLDGALRQHIRSL